MPRPNRIESENAYYHVLNRGVAKRRCFDNTNQRELFIKLLINACDKFQSEIHAYCLMDNHYHLLIKTPGAQLAKTMHDVLSKYVKAFNQDNNRDGPLFRDRYKAIPILHNEHLLQVSRYIHLNPVEANITPVAQYYPWSSYQYYMNPSLKPNWLCTKDILSCGGIEYEQNLAKQIKLYHEYVTQHQ